MESKHAARIFIGKTGRKITGPPNQPQVGGRVTPEEKKEAAAKPKGALASKTKKPAQPSRRPARATSKAERLVCRYCGSNDLAPSFKKRRDARCRACFKKRYGSAARSKRTTQTRTGKATK
jgi:hypothetical protein